MLAGVNTVHVFRDEYTLALRHALWLHYEVNFGLLLDVILDLILELTHLIGKEPGLREELVVLGKLPLHFLEISSEVIFPCDLKHARKMIDSLEWLDFLE
jgi:hypothetical protein